MAIKQHRHPTQVRAAQSFEYDSARRDFTINSIGIRKDGEIVDYQGGLDDLKNNILKAVGDPKQRFTEDALRILRTLRFSVKLGFTVEPKTLEAAKELSHLVDTLSIERVQQEIYKVAELGGKALADYIVKLDELGLLQKILPEIYKLKNMPHDPKHHPEGGVLSHILSALKYSRSKDAVTNLSVLFHDCGKGVTYVPQKEHNGRVRIHTYDGHDNAGLKIIDEIGRRLKFSTEDIEAMKFACAKHMLFHHPENISKSKLATIINNKYWPILKEVVYCDEMARGDIDPKPILQKLENIEQDIKNLSGGGADDLKKKIKSLVSGNKVMEWIPDIVRQENKPKISKVIQMTTDYIIDNNRFDLTEDQIKTLAISFYQSLKGQ